MDMNPKIVAFFRVVITFIAISGIGLFIYGWFTHARDPSPILTFILLAILTNTLGIKFPQIDQMKKVSLDKEPPLTEKKENDKHG